MKKFALILILVLLFTGSAAAEQNDIADISKAIPPQALDLIEQSDYSEAGGFQEGAISLLKSGFGIVKDYARGSIKGVISLLFVIMLCDIADGMYAEGKGGKFPRYTTMAGALAIVLLSAGDISDLIGLGGETIEELNQFSKALLPTLAAATAASGSVAAAAVRQVATTFFADFLITCIDKLLVPLLYLYLGAITANAVLANDTLKAMAGGIKKVIVLSLTALVTVFTFYLTVSGALAGSADNLSLRAAKFALSGAVPVVGGILSDAAGSILAGATVLKNAIGVFGTLAVFAICLIPFIHLAVQYIIYKVVAFLAMTIDSTSLSGLVDKIGGAFGLILGMTGATAFLLIISIISSVSAVTH